MRPLVWWIVCWLAWAAIEAGAAVSPVNVTVPESKAWIGQRVKFFVELRAPGLFAGTAGFDLPQIPGTVVMKIGSPAVGSQDIEGESWFVQAHEFALFSQKSGVLEVPAFTVRFSHRDGFTGPTQDVKAEVPGWRLEIERPSGSDRVGYLITTESLDITETWEPSPGPARVGAMFKRTIIQQSPQIPGMALSPVPTIAPEGVRLYPGDSGTEDELERGDFLGKRHDTLTYLLTKPGKVSIPALRYVWWNPITKTLQSKSLPAVVFDVAPAPEAPGSRKMSAAHLAWPYLLTAILAICLAVLQRRRLAEWASRGRQRLNPPERAAERKLLRACGQHDIQAAAKAWQVWRNIQGPAFKTIPELHAAILDLQRHLYGPLPAAPWRGNELANAIGKQQAANRKRRSSVHLSGLPLLNPSDQQKSPSLRSGQ